MPKVLVVGGAGYIGSTTCAWLIDNGYQIWVLDDLSTGHRELALGEQFILGKAGDVERVRSILASEKFDCVMHFAAHSLVAESVQKQAFYHENNVEETRRLLDVLLESGVRRFIFSSSCAVFGDPGDLPIDEYLPASPLSPYGKTKLEVELILKNLAQERGLRSIVLRYFNAAGAEPQLRVGEWHEPESHLIPSVLKSLLKGETLQIFGTDYPTPDGTCIRDYVHVWDLAAAHGAALKRLLAPAETGSEASNEGFHKGFDEGSYEAYNLGSGSGFSVREIIQASEKATGGSAKVIESKRRPGDASKLVASSRLAFQVLGFNPQYTTLQQMIASALAWEKKRSGILRKAVFLDRDGTLNPDPGYLSDPSQMSLIPGVAEALVLLRQAGYLLVVVSNQSGVARGLIREEDLPKIHQRLEDLLRPWCIKIEHFALCLHHPEEHCACRKPKPKLILDAARALQIDVTQSYMIGDRQTDIEAGVAAGCKQSILVEGSLLDIAKSILAQESEGF